MTGITPENVGKHGVLTFGESRLVGVLNSVSSESKWPEFQFLFDGQEVPAIFDLLDGWSFTPDAPKARLGMIVKLGALYLTRDRDGWNSVTDGGQMDYADDDLAHLIANPVFPGVADL